VDGVVCILAVHHFTSRAKAFREMARVCPRGPIVVFAHDVGFAVDPWFAHYFPRLWSDATAACPSTQELIDTFEAAGRAARSLPFEVPHDIRDAFMAAGWRRPEMYLDPEIRRGISGFALSDQSEIDKGLRRLQADIADGTWRTKYAELLSRESIDWGYRFVYCESVLATLPKM
jgi:SAM-dependent methyltransferase